VTTDSIALRGIVIAT